MNKELDEIYEGSYANVNDHFTHEDEENITFTKRDIDTLFCTKCGVNMGYVEDWLLEGASINFLECDDCLAENLADEVDERIENLINYYT